MENPGQSNQEAPNSDELPSEILEKARKEIGDLPSVKKRRNELKELRKEYENLSISLKLGFPYSKEEATNRMKVNRNEQREIVKELQIIKDPLERQAIDSIKNIKSK